MKKDVEFPVAITKTGEVIRLERVTADLYYKWVIHAVKSGVKVAFIGYDDPENLDLYKIDRDCFCSANEQEINLMVMLGCKVSTDEGHSDILDWNKPVNSKPLGMHLYIDDRAPRELYMHEHILNALLTQKVSSILSNYPSQAFYTIESSEWIRSSAKIQAAKYMREIKRKHLDGKDFRKKVLNRAKRIYRLKVLNNLKRKLWNLLR